MSVAKAALFQFLILAPFHVLGPLIAERELGGAAAWSAISAGFGAGALVGAVVVLCCHPKHPLRAGTLVSLAAGPSLVLLSIPAPVAAIVAAEVAAGAAVVVFDTWWTTALQRHVPDDQLSKVSSYDWLGSLALRPVGLLAAAPAAELFGVRAVLIGACAINLLAGLGSLLVPGIWRMPTDASRSGQDR